MHAMQNSVKADGLADILERVLDKGIVVAGDVSVSLVGIELLTIKLRLLITTVDKAMEMGINWWESDPMLSSRNSELQVENDDLRQRLETMHSQMQHLVAAIERQTAVQAQNSVETSSTPQSRGAA